MASAVWRNAHEPRPIVAEDRGAAAIEYGMMAPLMAVVIIGAMKTVGTRLNAKFATISNGLGTWGTEPTLGYRRRVISFDHGSK